MGYSDRIFKFGCLNCGKQRLVRPRNTPQYSGACRQCDADIHLQPLREWPDVPREVSLGWYENKSTFRIYAVPPGEENQPWADPYSIRSFVCQAARTLMNRPIRAAYSKAGSGEGHAPASRGRAS